MLISPSRRYFDCGVRSLLSAEQAASTAPARRQRLMDIMNGKVTIR